jgi:hypothetical protein
MGHRSLLRDLADQIDRAARAHPGYHQAQEVVVNCVDHLNAKAQLEEIIYRDHQRRAEHENLSNKSAKASGDTERH